MSRHKQHADRIVDQISTIASALPNGPASEFMKLPRLQRTHTDWVMVRAQLYQALAVQYCESAARQKLVPLDDLINAHDTASRKGHRWRWGFLSL